LPIDRFGFKVDQKISTPGTNNERGTGLGLKICKEFAELHSGSIQVESESGKGCKFIVKIPVG
jgi:two-component system, sensor histidine kinase and response regulator